MRRSLPSFYRFIACILMTTVMTSSIAMAAYICPQLAPVADSTMAGMPCAEMDKEKPVQCATLHSGADLALEHLATAPALTPVVVAFSRPAPVLAGTNLQLSASTGVVHDAIADPPYRRTLRLRI